jgi:hypothetical protein
VIAYIALRELRTTRNCALPQSPVQSERAVLIYVPLGVRLGTVCQETINVGAIFR